MDQAWAPGEGLGEACGRGRSAGSPGQQSDPRVVILRTGEQLPAAESLDVRHVVPIPSAAHQGLQGLDSGAGEGQRAAEVTGPVPPARLGPARLPEPPCELLLVGQPWRPGWHFTVRTGAPRWHPTARQGASRRGPGPSPGLGVQGVITTPTSPGTGPWPQPSEPELKCLLKGPRRLVKMGGGEPRALAGAVPRSGG